MGVEISEIPMAAARGNARPSAGSNTPGRQGVDSKPKIIDKPTTQTRTPFT